MTNTLDLDPSWFHEQGEDGELYLWKWRRWAKAEVLAGSKVHGYILKKGDVLLTRLDTHEPMTVFMPWSEDPESASTDHSMTLRLRKTDEPGVYRVQIWGSSTRIKVRVTEISPTRVCYGRVVDRSGLRLQP